MEKKVKSKKLEGGGRVKEQSAVSDQPITPSSSPRFVSAGAPLSARGEGSDVDKGETLYTVGLWNGLKQFKCVQCGFDTFNEEKMFKHAQTHLPKPPLPHVPAVLVADKWGNEVQFVQGAEDDEVFEVELRELNSTVEANGDVHKTFTIKE